MTPSRIYLIGFMGAGKSAVGRKLATLLDYELVDLDHYIESRYHKTVTDLFSTYGEEGFRRIEQKSLHEAGALERTIISTGGGAPCFFSNMEFMNQTGLTIFINPSEETLTQRLLLSKTPRPLIIGKSEEELRDFIHERMLQRKPFYEQAKIHFSSNDILHNDTQKLIELINHYEEEIPTHSR